jgi:MFS family permease
VVALSQLAQLVFTVALGLDLLLGIIQVWHLFVFTVLAGGAWAFNQPARQTLVFDVVPRRVVPNAVALSNVAFSFSRTFGSAGAGALLVAFGAATSFFLQGLANLTIMSTVLLMRLPAGRPAPAQRRSVLRELVDGYGYALRNPQARLLLLVMTINPLLLIPLHLALLPIFAAHVFASGAVGLGLMLGSIGAGGFLGGLLTASLNRVDRRGLLQLAALVVHSTAQAAFCLVGVLSGQLWLALPFLVVAGAAESVSQTTNQTVLQLLAPDHLRGRLTSALQVSVVIMPLGVLVAGSLADLFGAPAVGVGLSLTALATTLAILTFAPRLRRLRLSQLAQVKQLGLRA